MNACFAVSKTEAEEALNVAENGLSQAYVAVAEAESAGANISGLQVKLNDAGALLATARSAYGAGNYDAAYSFALSSSGLTSNMAVEASSLKSDAEKAYSDQLFVTAALSSIGLSVLFVLGLFCWRFLKKRYFKHVLKLKPEFGKAET